MNISSIIQAYGARPLDTTNGRARQVKDERPVSTPSAQVSISDTSRELKMVREAMDKEPEIRIPLVEELQAKIKNNDYPIQNRMAHTLEKMFEARILA